MNIKKQEDIFNRQNITVYSKEDIIKNIISLVAMHRKGLLGGEKMPEDARPESIEIDSFDNYHFLTLPMSLNYQRNSYTLRESAAKTYNDEECNDVFIPEAVTKMATDELREKLLKHKVALQPNKHIDTWQRISSALCDLSSGDVRKLIKENYSDVVKIREFMQVKYKKRFPYISGEKIFNYWLYVISDYTNEVLINRNNITIAPDTHILQASIRLGVTKESLDEISKKRGKIAEEWEKILNGTEISPIDIHTPLWLWSKSGFPNIVS